MRDSRRAVCARKTRRAERARKTRRAERARSARCAERARSARCAAAILAICAIALIGLAAAPADALAHSGQLSPKDGCHRHKAAGERHWHQDGTAERGGACIKQDGIAYRVLEVEAPAPEVETPWEVCADKWAALTAEIGGYWAPRISTAAAGLTDCLRGAYPRRE